MKITKTEIYIIEMDYEEISAIYSLIWNTSSDNLRERGFTEDEISKLTGICDILSPQLIYKNDK